MSAEILKFKKKKILKITVSIFAVIFVLCLILCIVYVDNKNVRYERFTIGMERGTEIKIAHISDLHFPRIKADTQAVADTLKDEKPDIIAVTGDTIHNGKGIQTNDVWMFFENLLKIAPVFYIEGNHEVENPQDAVVLEAGLAERGVIILKNEYSRLLVRGVHVTIIGLKDNDDYLSEYAGGNGDGLRILLAHRPEKFALYSDSSHSVRPHLVLSGHAHGGQFRFFGQGVLSPGQGFFPKYDAGLYTSLDGAVHMVVSCGVGNSLFPFRFNNPPHIPIIKVFAD